MRKFIIIVFLLSLTGVASARCVRFYNRHGALRIVCRYHHHRTVSRIIRRERHLYRPWRWRYQHCWRNLRGVVHCR